MERHNTKSDAPTRTTIMLPPPRRREAEHSRESRRHPRLPLVVEVSIASEHNFFVGLSGDISEGGLFIATHLTRPLGCSMLVTFTLPNETEPILAEGVVRWVRVYQEDCETPPGMGIRFVSLSHAAEEGIGRFIKSRRPLFWD